MPDHQNEMMLLREAVGQQRAGNHEQAATLYKALLKLAPDNIDALHFLGILESQFGNYDKSVKLIARAIELIEGSGGQNPNYSNALNNLGNAYRYCGKPDIALDTYKHAHKICSDDATIVNNIGNVLRDLHRPSEAIEYFKRAITKRPDYIDPYINLGNVFKEQGQLDEAIESYNNALLLNNNHAGAHNNLAVALLSAGNFKNGWKEYEWRWQANKWTPRPYKHPVWREQPLEGKNILVYAEQGIGDEIMFSSCIPDLLSVANNVIIDCSPRLEPIFKRSFPTAICRGVDRNVTLTDGLSEVPEIDLQIASGSLPLHLRPAIENFPSHQGYLKTDSALINKWNKRYAALNAGFVVGISWYGGTSIADKTARSLDLLEWVEILGIPDIHFVNLQYGDFRNDIMALYEQSGIQLHDWDDANPLGDMDNFAAQIKCLDLVISVDNSTVHMAGSMGVETWVLQPFCGDWRWLRGSNSSYWYPGIRNFWQHSPREWAPVIKTISTRLRERSLQIK